MSDRDGPSSGPPPGGDDASFAEALGQAMYPETPPVPLPRTTLARIVETYDFTLRRLGETPGSVLWRSRASQRQRFRQLLGVLGADRWRRGLVINDFGCGYGALFEHIRRKWFLRGGRYQGYDLCPRMVRAARARLTDPRVTIVEAAEPTLEADYTLCSGTFGLKLDTPAADWWVYVQASLRTVAARSRRGFAFNLLHARTPADQRKDDLFYADPDAVMAFCRDVFGPGVTLVDDYTPVDFTVRVRL